MEFDKTLQAAGQLAARFGVGNAILLILVVVVGIRLPAVLEVVRRALKDRQEYLIKDKQTTAMIARESERMQAKLKHHASPPRRSSAAKTSRPSREKP